MASEAACTLHNLTPLVRLVDYSVAGVCPTVMGRGPVPAIHQILDKSGLRLDDVGLVDVSNIFIICYVCIIILFVNA